MIHRNRSELYLGDDEKHLTLVCYKGGYGGDFFCALLDEAINNLPFKSRDANNRYWSTNYVFRTFNQSVKNLNYILSNYDDRSKFAGVFENEEYDEVMKLYDLCRDDDRQTFESNLMFTIKSNMYLPYKFNVANLHYSGEFPKFKVTDIHDPISVIFLAADDPLHRQYFHTFSKIKTRFKSYNYRAKINDRVEWKPLEYAVKIDVGKLYFEDSLDETISDTLSDIIGTDIKINIDELRDYKLKNDSVLKSYMGDDYRSLSVEEFRIKKFKLFERAIEGEFN